MNYRVGCEAKKEDVLIYDHHHHHHRLVGLIGPGVGLLFSLTHPSQFEIFVDNLSVVFVTGPPSNVMS